MAMEIHERYDHVHVLTLGGTIDKDYPKLTSGYAFEFGEESAAERILKSHPNLGITYQVKSICKKDSLEITQQDREILARSIFDIVKKEKSKLPRIIVTHGTDTMIETAGYVKRYLSQNNMHNAAIAFTGATKPERFVDSDASFNVGSALGATACCQGPAVLICMNGKVIPAEECVRDEESGLFMRAEIGSTSSPAHNQIIAA